AAGLDRGARLARDLDRLVDRRSGRNRVIAGRQLDGRAGRGRFFGGLQTQAHARQKEVLDDFEADRVGTESLHARAIGRAQRVRQRHGVRLLAHVEREGLAVGRRSATEAPSGRPPFCAHVDWLGQCARVAESESAQGYTPFEGQELSGKVVKTFLRGELVYDGGEVVGPARGRYLRR